MSATTVDRVGLDGFNLAAVRGTGVATYARALSHAFKGMGRSVDVLYGLDVPKRVSRTLRETLFFAALGEGRTGGEAPDRITFRRALRRLVLSPLPRDLIEVPVAGRVVATTLADRMPAYDRLFSLPSLFYLASRHFRRYGRFLVVRVPDPPAIMHWTYPLPLRLAGARNVYTLHDLVPLRLPFTSLDDRRYYDRLVRACIARGDHICTVSEASRRDILDLFGADPERVTNTYQAVSPATAASALDDAGAARQLQALFDLKAGEFLLYFGAIEPKKNLARLIQAYLVAGVETPLIIAGPRAWRADEELRLLEGGHGAPLSGAKRIRLIGYVSAGHLPTLVRGAKAVLFPSLYEGFGLPALEAMSLGVPVMASAVGGLAEVVGDAGLLVDPYDVDAISEALRRLDADPSLCAALSQAGRTQAARFSMAAYQARLSALHRRILAAPASAARPTYSTLFAGAAS